MMDNFLKTKGLFNYLLKIDGNTCVVHIIINSPKIPEKHAENSRKTTVQKFIDFSVLTLYSLVC